MSEPMAHSGGHSLAKHLQSVAQIAAVFHRHLMPPLFPSAGPIWPVFGMTLDKCREECRTHDVQ